MRFLDVMKVVAPVAVAFIPGVGIPAAIALSAAMSGGISAAEGKSTREILRDTALGAASGAGGAAIGGAISRGASSLASKTAEKAMDVGVEEMAKASSQAVAKGGIEAVPELSAAATGRATSAVTKAAPKVARYQQIAKLTSGALGKDPEKTSAMLKTVKSGGKVVRAADMAYQTAVPPEDPEAQARAMQQSQQTFMEHQADLMNRIQQSQQLANHPGYDDKYQFGALGQQRWATPALGFGRFY